MPEIKKAVITAAGAQQRHLPLQTLVDRDGVTKSALRIIIDEAIRAGVQELGIIIHPGDQAAYAAAAGTVNGKIHFLEQAEPRGYGHAVLCAREFVGRDPFLLLVGDHLYLTYQPVGCAQQLIEAARAEGCAISGVQSTHESKLPYYGAVGGRLLPGRSGLYSVEAVLEKPTPTVAEQRLIVPGLRAGHYLCFFGMHVLSPTVMDLLERAASESSPGKSIQLSPALALLAQRERYLAMEIRGERHDIGRKYGLLNAQIALAVAGADRAEVLSHLVEVLARGHLTH